MDKLVSTFEGRGLRRGGILFIGPDEAIELIEAARHQNNPILGVDSFIVSETSTQPFMEHGPDYSNLPRSADTWSKAREFIEQQRNAGFLFEVVI
jgi:hypothetical protein